MGGASRPRPIGTYFRHDVSARYELGIQPACSAAIERVCSAVTE